jgi:hypothetical protein
MSPSAECGHCHVRRPRRSKSEENDATGLEVPTAPERRTTAGCRPLLRKDRTPADWSGARRSEDVGQDAHALRSLGDALLAQRTPMSVHAFHLLTA